MSDACARGCKVARRHATDCDTDTCRGCRPRSAEYGLLCYSCHKRLDDMLKTTPGQVALLDTATVKEGSLSTALKDDADRIRGAQDGPLAPLNLDAHDVARKIGDILSEWVEMLCSDYGLKGPQVFDVRTGSTWLRAQLERLEYCEGIGDLWEELAEVMAQAHALAPWREQSHRIPQIPCPECHTVALVLFGGDEDITCRRCRAMIDPGRYAIWVRMFLAEKEKTA